MCGLSSKDVLIKLKEFMVCNERPFESINWSERLPGLTRLGERLVISGPQLITELDKYLTNEWSNHGFTNAAAFVTQLLNRNRPPSAYIKLNFDLKSGQATGSYFCGVQTTLRARYDTDGATETADELYTSLILLGGIGSHSGLHLDRGEAFTVAIAVDEEDLNEPLAIWTLFPPDSVKHVRCCVS